MFFESKKFKKIGLVLIAVLIPVFMLSLSVNLVTRAHDVYKYNLEHSEALRDMDITLDAEDMSYNISAYMLGKSDSIKTVDKTSENYDPDAPVVEFSESDYQKLTGVKRGDNVMVILFGFCFLAFVFILFVIITENDYTQKAELRRRFLLGSGITMGAWILLLIYAFMTPVYDFVDRTIGFRWEAGDMLNVMFGRSLIQEFIVAGTLLNIAVLLIIMYTLWQFTKPRKIF